MNLSRILIVSSLAFLAGCASGPPRQDLSQLAQKASAGDPVAQRQLGAAHDSTGSRNPNHQEAARWYHLAANQGDAIAQNNLGSLYEHGLGVPKDFSNAFELYRKSAEQGFAMAQNSLGRMYDLGMGVATNEVQANAWYLRAAEQGDAQAMFNLGVNHGFGRGVPQDRVKAFMWLDLARFFTQRSPDMKTKWTIRGVLDDLKKLMTLDEIRAGERLSREWYGGHTKAHKVGAATSPAIAQ